MRENEKNVEASSSLSCGKLGPVGWKPISANHGLNVVQGLWFSCLKALPLLILRGNWKPAKVKLLTENILRESTSLMIKRELVLTQVDLGYQNAALQLNNQNDILCSDNSNVKFWNTHLFST